MAKVGTINTKTYRRNLVLAVLICSLLASSLTLLGTRYVLSQAISNPGTTYGPGDIDDYNYIVYKEGATYYAKNGMTREINCSGTNASQIIQNALTYAGTQSKVILSNDIFVCDTNLYVQDSQTISGAGRWATRLQFTGSGTLLGVNNKAYVHIENLGIQLQGTNQYAIRGQVQSSYIENVLIEGQNNTDGNVGIWLEDESYFNHIANCYIVTMETGIYFTETTPGELPNANVFYNVRLGTHNTAIDVDAGHEQGFYDLWIGNVITTGIRINTYRNILCHPRVETSGNIPCVTFTNNSKNNLLLEGILASDAADNALISDSGVGNTFINPTSNVADTSPLNLDPQSTAPGAPRTGDIYLDDGTNTGDGLPHLRFYNGTAWNDL